MFFLTNNNGKTISLTQHGTQTAKNKNSAITAYAAAFKPPSAAMAIWNSDAQVLMST